MTVETVLFIVRRYSCGVPVDLWKSSGTHDVVHVVSRESSAHSKPERGQQQRFLFRSMDRASDLNLKVRRQRASSFAILLLIAALTSLISAYGEEIPACVEDCEEKVRWWRVQRPSAQA